MSDEAIMKGFRFLKAVVNRYGPQEGANLLALADRLVIQGQFANKREAVNAIERQMGLEPTQPLSEEVTNHASEEYLRKIRGNP